MLRNYFKIAWRSLIKNKTSSLINICGLAIGLTMAILILLWITDMVSYDKFHANLRDIYQLMQNQNRGGDIFTSSSVPGPLAASLRNNTPEIKYISRVSFPDNQSIKVGDKIFDEVGMFADPDYFRMMSFAAVEGNPISSLNEAASAVITERTAVKLFGKEDPIGKIFLLNGKHDVKVGAVIRNVPDNSSIRFDVMLPFRICELDDTAWIDKWDNNRIQTWVQLVPGANVADLNARMTQLLQRQQDDKKVEMFAYPFSDIWLRGQFKNGKQSGGRKDGLTMLGIIGIFVLLIACINFMNLATARSEHRAREVGVRKTLGASRKQIILQFLTEALLITGFAMLLGVLVSLLALPALNRYTERNIPFNFLQKKVWIGVLGMGIVTGLVAGSYPALFLSSFNPVRVLKGAISGNTGKSFLRKGLVTFQFVIAIFLLVVTIIIFRQLQYGEDRPLGYDQENLIEIPVNNALAAKYSVLKNDLLQIPGVKSISAGSDDLLGFNAGVNGIDWPGKTPGQDFKMAITYVQYDWAKTTGLKLAEGRDFSSSFGTDSLACLINQSAARKMNLKPPVVGAKIGHNTVAGVVEDFIYDNPFTSPKPLIVYLDTGNLSHIFLRINNDQGWRKCLDQIAFTFKKSNDNHPVDIHFTREEYQRKFSEMHSTGQLINGVCALAILISCLGLFGLSAFLAERRTKEIGIRKVLGASVSGIWFMLSLDFLKPVFIAFFIAAPLAGWVMQKTLVKMEYHIGLSWWMFILAGLLSIIIAILTVSFHGAKAALANPARSLQAE